MLPTAIYRYDKKFVQDLLKSSENDESIKVTGLTLEPATAPGDNELSDMIRATVEYSRNNSGCNDTAKRKFIIKIAAIRNKEIAAGLGVFRKEIAMMDTILVKMNELWNEEGSRFSPRVLYTDNGEPPCIVMEDLSELGYRMLDRVAGLDLEHSIIAIRGLARFHASSVLLWEKDPKLFESYNKSVFYEGSPNAVKLLMVNGLRVLANELLNWSELGDSARSYSDKLLKFSDVCFEKAIHCVQSMVGGFSVMNHGDVWVNNILFRYNNEDKVIDSIFVDFQLSWWSSPAMDILNFVNTSLSEDVDLHHVDTLLEEYLKTLTNTMTRLCCSTKAPNMTDLKKSLQESEILEVLVASTNMPIITTPRDAPKVVDGILELGEKYVNPAYKTQGYRRKILKRLSAWNSSGVLDV